MASDRTELIERLLRRFKGVPNFEITDAEELVDESLKVHGIDDPSAGIPSDEQTVIMLYAQVQGAWQIAFSVAHYFKFTDGEESVDKSMIADNYRKLAREIQRDYDAEINPKKGTTSFTVMTRLDRP